MYFLVRIKLSNRDVGVAKSIVFRETKPGGAGFTTGDFVEQKLGGLR